MIELRRLTADDWQLWREVRLAALAEAPAAFRTRLAEWQGDGDREERWRARLALPGGHAVLAVVDGRPAGVLTGLSAAEGSVVDLLSMWVAPEARGRGVGDALMHAVEQWAREAGATTLRLAVVLGNAPATALYARNGFVPTGQEDGELVMTKDLGTG